MNIDIFDCLEAEIGDEYLEIKELLQAEEDIDWEELMEKELTIWSTANGDITISMEGGNILTVTARDDNDLYGKCSTYDIDGYGLVCCTMSALRDYILDVELTYTNQP